MALVLADRVKETTTSTGTAAITLAGAATGYQTFSSAVGDANTTYYTIADQTGANWEVGVGAYTTSGNTLSRDTVLASSNAGSLVTFTAGTKDVFISYPAERALYTGGPLGTPSSGTLTNATGYTYANLSGTVPTWNQNTTGTAANVTGLVAVANGGTGTATPALVAGSNVTISGTWPNQTINATSSGGTVTSVTGTAPVVSSGGTAPAISMAAATTTVNGYLTSTDWNTFNGKYSTGGALGTPSSGTLSSCTVDGTNGVGYINIPQNSQSAAYTLVAADAGKHIFHPSTDANARTFTIPANGSVAYPIGTAISFVNMTSQVVSIAITTDTMYLAGTGTTGTRSLAQYGTATALKMTSTTWIISGAGLT
jgi:hypothetical protein